MNRHKLTASVLILTILLVTGLLIITMPGNAYSETENRVLSEKPQLSLAEIMSGSFQKKLDKYLSDQFPGRNNLMQLGTKIKLLSGRRDIENTYIGKDNYFFEKITDADIDEKNYRKNLGRIESLADKYDEIKFTTMLVPSSGVVLSDKLPDNAEFYDAEKLYQVADQAFANVKLTDPTEEMIMAKDDYIYYKTDHHWTTYGSYIGYRSLMGEAAVYEYSARETDVVSDSFLGTLYSRTLDDRAVPDSVELVDISDEIEVIVDGESGAVYDYEALNEKDKYRVFFGGNYGLTEINNCQGEGTLLILKDSFANSMVPFLTTDYGKIVMIDLRYYAGSVSGLLEAGDIDEVLVLYEIYNFASDTNLAKLVL